MEAVENLSLLSFARGLQSLDSHVINLQISRYIANQDLTDTTVLVIDLSVCANVLPLAPNVRGRAIARLF